MSEAMKYMLLSAVAGVMACGSCVHSPVVEAPNTQVLPAVGRLMMTDPDTGDTRFVCTVWKVGTDLVATAGHCCEKDETYTLAGPNAEPGAEAHILVDVGGDNGDPAENDVCIMRGHLRGEPVQLALHDPSIGSRIWTLGYPQGIFLISDGIWAGRDDENLGVCSSVVNPGASGSPVLDAQSHAVGVLVRYRRGMDNLTFVAPLEKLRFALHKAQLIRDEPKD